MEKNEQPDLSFLDLILEEKIGLINTAEAAPQELKEEIFSTLDSLHLIAEIADLFTVKFSLTKMSMLEAAGNAGKMAGKPFHQETDQTPAKDTPNPPDH